MIFSHEGKVVSCDVSLKRFWKFKKNNKEKWTYSTKSNCLIQEDLEKRN